MSNSPGEAVRALLREAVDRLAARHDQPRLDAEVLLAHLLAVPRTRLHARPETLVSPERAGRYRELIARRAEGEPVAHLTGVREFWSLEFEVTRDTLIPRPETELLVEIVLECVPGERPCRIADLGTGCGAIAVAIAREREGARVVATDLSDAALAVAARNAARLAPDNVAFEHGNWCEALTAPPFDVIVCNPPYVREDDAHLAEGDVACEPRAALVAGRDGLDAIRIIARDAREHLRPGATLALEHGHDQGPAVRALLGVLGYGEVRAHLDLAGHERAASARRR